MTNLISYPDLNHRVWKKTWRHLKRIDSVPSPNNTTSDVIGFQQKIERGYYGYCFCYSSIANTEYSKTYTVSIWSRTNNPNFNVTLYTLNNSSDRQSKYTFYAAKKVTGDSQWHKLSWEFTNPVNLKTKSVNFRLHGGHTGQNYLYNPVLLEKVSDTNTNNNESTNSTNVVSLQTFSNIYKNNIDAVVNIMMQAQNNYLYSGTGFFISDDGYIVTAAHVVIQGNTAPEPYAKKVWIHYYPENLITEATIIGVDRLYDVALIKVNLENRKFLTFKDSRLVEIGSFAITIGQPLGNHVQSITSGIIRENKGQDYSWMAESLIVDFEIVGGNSGGPVLDIDGKVIGIVSWGLTVGAFSLNGSIASYAAIKVIENIKGRYQESPSPPLDYPSSYIGISFDPIDMYHEVIDTKIPKVEGVIVLSVQSGSPAALAGIKVNDIITKANEQLVGKANNQVPLGTIIHFWPIGSSLDLKVLEAPNYGVQDVSVTTVALPDNYDYIFSNKYNINELVEKKKTIFT